MIAQMDFPNLRFGNENELKMMIDALKFLVKTIEEETTKRIPFSKASSLVERYLLEKGVEEYREVAEAVVNLGLNNWIIDKIVDYASVDSDREYEWFLLALSKEETEKLQNMSEEKKAFIKILRNREVEGRLGVITESDALMALRNQGHDVEFVPFIPGKTSDFARSTNDGEIVVWHYLIPQYELTDDS